jgi:glutathione peroxidase
MSIYNLSFINNKDEKILLSNFKDKVVLIVNVASKCGFTKQYEGLQKLNDKYADSGLFVIGFPCNQFGGQEPGTDEEIKEFCSLNYNINFELAKKIEVNGPGTHPIYKYLKDNAKGGNEINWNFEKFLISKSGQLFNYSPDITPEQLELEIEKLLS